MGCSGSGLPASNCFCVCLTLICSVKICVLLPHGGNGGHIVPSGPQGAGQQATHGPKWVNCKCTSSQNQPFPCQGFELLPKRGFYSPEGFTQVDLELKISFP